MSAERLIYLPLGGAGEIGMNLYLYELDGQWLMVDCGIAFADDRRTVMVTGENKNALLLRVDLDMPQRSATAKGDVTVMSFNVQNLFDNVDDPDKDDKAYLPLAAKQNDAHIAACNEIEVESWRNECLYLDWNDEALEYKLGVVAESIRQVNDGRGADIVDGFLYLLVETLAEEIEETHDWCSFHFTR